METKKYIGEFMKLKNQIFESLYSSDDEVLYKNVPIKYVIENKISICESLLKKLKEQRKYKNGKIYKLECLTTGNCYIGSTINSLNERLRQHKSRRSCKAREILDNNNYKMNLLEAYPCNSKKELETREYFYINNTNKCINRNKYIGRTDKEWYIDNKEVIKLYRKKNQDKIKLKKKLYREKNRELINLKQREARQLKKQLLDQS